MHTHSYTHHTHSIIIKRKRSIKTLPGNLCNSYRIKQTERGRARNGALEWKGKREWVREWERERRVEREAAGIWKDTHAWHLHGPTIGFDNRIRAVESALSNPNPTPGSPRARIWICASACLSLSLLCRSSISIALPARRWLGFRSLLLSLHIFFCPFFVAKTTKLHWAEAIRIPIPIPMQYPIPIPIAIPIAICTYRRFGHVNF